MGQNLFSVINIIFFYLFNVFPIGGYAEFFVGLAPRLLKRCLTVPTVWVLYEKLAIFYNDKFKE